MIFDFVFLGTSLSTSLKIIFYLVLTYYVFINHEYFTSKVENIFLINTVVVLANIILGYYFKIGDQSYSAFEDSYRGFMAGNDTSIFSFVAFGFGLYHFKKQRIVSILVMGFSLLAMYIIATKAIFVAGMILLLYFKNSIKGKVVLVPIFLSIVVLSYAYVNFRDVFEERLLYVYTKSIVDGEKMITASAYNDSYVLSALNQIAPGRIVRGVALFDQLVSDNVIKLLFGYGVGGIYVEYGRPPMMDIFKMMGFYGLIGFSCLYFPLIQVAFKNIKKLDFDLIGVLFLTMFLYGSLGGFLLDSANSSSIFALLFGILLSRYYPLREEDAGV